MLLDAGVSPICGVDEAGRGACAGPLVVVAIILRDLRAPELGKVRDSKELSEITREKLYDAIVEQSLAMCVVEIPAEEIDNRGVHAANIDGMRRAVQGLEVTPEYVLTDGYVIPGLGLPTLGVWKGDQVVRTISAASIIAKVTRDRIMRRMDGEYPNYGFAKHKGYVTASHAGALVKHGISEIHRRSFSNVAAHIHSSD